MTVTVLKDLMADVIEQMRSCKITTVEMALTGSFHWRRHLELQDALRNFCNRTPAFNLPAANTLKMACRSDVALDLNHITSISLSEIAINAILIKPSNWWETAKTICSANDSGTTIVTLGPERCIPPSIFKEASPSLRFIHLADVMLQRQNPFRSVPGSEDGENDIAIIGMAVQVAGAEDLNEFWKRLADAESQHSEVPESRFGFETAFRDLDDTKKWYGNFIKDYDTFDHKFFKKSPREAASMDPQQRLLMQVAYQAVEQSGYFRKARPSVEEIGCYIAACAVDYEANIACHAPNAFSSTGSLRGFIAGKLSHYFGWTGPGLTLDTACSGAAVAVHLACKAILAGECTSALAGGVNVITQPLPYQNLAAASFLSSSGQCKPFCTHADGYCRGEGVAAVFLKKRSEAVADGDQIFGVIAGSAITQNQNCTPIFVPNASSLSNLFQKVLKQARLNPDQVSYVEAHGTGTPVGDPAEYDSIKQIFAQKQRAQPLQLGSVKGLVGHTESTSGLVSLVKVALMMHEGAVPPQASFTAMNPHIETHPSITISNSLRPWNNTYKAALINNYGASGSNASLVVTRPLAQAYRERAVANTKFPFWIAAADDKSLEKYTQKLKGFLDREVGRATGLSLAALAFNLSRQSNRQLNRAVIMSCSSIQQLRQQIEGPVASVSRPQSQSVIMCFGGQVSTFVGLDKVLFDGTTILRLHLDQCDAICQQLGLGSIYPDIFQRSPIQDIVKLQLCLFSLQYACARSWISNGVMPSALVGHSFGELTAWCVSEALSLVDTIRMVSGRAKIIRDAWGPEKGAMLAVEADEAQVSQLLQNSDVPIGSQRATIACYNSSTSFTLAGSNDAIDALTKAIKSDSAYSTMRSKKLSVTNAFHSTLVDNIKDEVNQMANGLRFRKPAIPVESATEAQDRGDLASSHVADHLRNPVYFNHAVQRLSLKYPSCVWLEAGSNSTVTAMISRALDPSRSGDSERFQSVNITSEGSVSHLATATLGLWRAGVDATFWQHHSSQTHQYPILLLPPYQFEKTKHLLELKSSAQLQSSTASAVDESRLFAFDHYQDSNKQSPRFRVLTGSSRYIEMVSSHLIAQTAPICPATLQVDMAIEALRTLYPELRNGDLLPQLRDVDNLAPICFDSSKIVWLDFSPIHTQLGLEREWEWKISSENSHGPTAPTLHVTGQIMFGSSKDVRSQQEFSQYERLVHHKRCLEVLQGDEPSDDIVQGQSIYRMFDGVVQYGELYQGLQRLVGRRLKNESAGRVIRKHSGQTWLDAQLADCFSQVAGIWVNCMTERAVGDMYIANGFEKWLHSPKMSGKSSQPETWDVLACHEQNGSNSFVSDIFVFDSRNGALVELIVGISFARVPKASMSKLLSRMSMDTKGKEPELAVANTIPVTYTTAMMKSADADTSQTPVALSSTQADIVSPKLLGILAELSGLEGSEISLNAELADLGIDSLMGMELAREVENKLQCSLSVDVLGQVVSVQGLVDCVKQAIGLGTGESTDSNTHDSSNCSDDKSTPRSSIDSSPPASATEQRRPTNEAMTTPTQLDLQLPSAIPLDSFTESKALTDGILQAHGCDKYLQKVMPLQTQLCIALTLDSFEELGGGLRQAKPGQLVQRVHHIPELSRLVDYLYNMLEKEAQVIQQVDGQIFRTSTPCPTASSDSILQTLLQQAPEHHYPHRLIHFCGLRLAEVLTGKSDGVRVIFGTEEGRELATGLYADSPLNKQSYAQMIDFIRRMIRKIPAQSGPINILELGAGTGGTTRWIAPLLAELGFPVVYTFSDLSPSLVAFARKRFGKTYPWMTFRTFDVEKVPPADLISSQHIVLASNAVHATHSLVRSLTNTRKTLRSDGLLLLVEMTSTLYWVDMIFGLLEGWWLFDDGRQHAIAHETRWAHDLKQAGFGDTDWTDGVHAETAIQRLIISLNNRHDDSTSSDESRQDTVEAYVKRYTEGFHVLSSPPSRLMLSQEPSVLITGATGSLGSHLVGYFSRLPQVKRIICLNRKSSFPDAEDRQKESLRLRGIDFALPSKLQIIETDTAKPYLGLDQEQYTKLAASITHIIHNAWPMSGKRPIKGFETQFRAMRNLLDLANAATSTQNQRIGFQFISSIAVVGYYPLVAGTPLVPEERMTTTEAVLPNGYGDAKWVCELMLDETLHRSPQRFNATAVRLGQIAGSKTSGYWNHAEHLTFLVQSSQTLRAFPNLEGLLSWTPVDDVAAALGELLLPSATAASQLIYHIDNPIRQSWKETADIIASAIGAQIVPFGEWVHMVREAQKAFSESENPAARLIDFFEYDFVRMSCGGLLLDTKKACEDSGTMRAVKPVDARAVQRYIEAWKAAGVLKD